MPDFSFFQNNSIGNKVSSLAGNITNNLQSTVSNIAQGFNNTIGNFTSQLSGIGRQIPNLETLLQTGPQQLFGGAVETPEQARSDILGGNEVLKFPANIHDDSLLIRFFQTKPPTGLEGLGKPTDVPNISIILPLPSNLSEQFNVGYNIVDVGALIGSNLQTVRNLMPTIIGTAKYGDADQQGVMGNAVGSILRNQNVNWNTALYGMWQFIDALPRGNQVTGAISREMGVIPNPYPAQVFTGISFRNFEFEWALQPQNEAETKVLRKIIHEIKLRILPEIDPSQLWMHWPSKCQLHFSPRVMNLTKCVVNSLGVNYAPNGPAFYSTDDAANQNNPAPVQVNLRLGLTEVELVSQSTVRDWEESFDARNNFT